MTKNWFGYFGFFSQNRVPIIEPAIFELRALDGPPD
jgi:hypothetical protein